MPQKKKLPETLEETQRRWQATDAEKERRYSRFPSSDAYGIAYDRIGASERYYAGRPAPLDKMFR